MKKLFDTLRCALRGGEDAVLVTIVASSGSADACHRSAAAPTATTSGSSRNQPTMGLAHTRQIAAAAAMSSVPYFTQKR